MAKSTPRKPAVEYRSNPPRPPADPPEVVDPVWLLKAGGITVALALFCGYLTLCFLVYQGQWQLVLHPDTKAPVAPADLPIQPIRFGASVSGQPNLTGWWIPGDTGARSLDTVLFLHDGSGNLAANETTLAALHTAGLSVFAIDYRGFGASDPTHPDQAHMTEDAAAALDYLLNTRHLPAKTIVPYGAGLGASLALHLAGIHPELPGVIVESANPDVAALAKADARTSFVPVSLFFHERFDVEPTLKTLKTPKLLLDGGPSPVITQAALDALYKAAATPSRIVHLKGAQPASFTEAVTRFLDEYMPAGPAQLSPRP